MKHTRFNVAVLELSKVFFIENFMRRVQMKKSCVFSQVF